MALAGQGSVYSNRQLAAVSKSSRKWGARWKMHGRSDAAANAWYRSSLRHHHHHRQCAGRQAKRAAAEWGGIDQ